MGGMHDCWQSKWASHMNRGGSLVAVERVCHTKSDQQFLFFLLADVIAT